MKKWTIWRLLGLLALGAAALVLLKRSRRREAPSAKTHAPAKKAAPPRLRPSI